MHAQIERVAAAAVLYLADPECSTAFAELEDAVEDLKAQPVEPGSQVAKAVAIVARLPRSTSPAAEARAPEPGR